MIIQGQNQFNYSFIITYLKHNIYKGYTKYIAKFQKNSCFENFTHELMVFAQYFDRST